MLDGYGGAGARTCDGEGKLGKRARQSGHRGREKKTRGVRERRVELREHAGPGIKACSEA